MVLTVISVLVVVRASDSSRWPGDTGPEGEAAGARVRIVHGIADAGPLDIYVDGSLALIGILFGNTSGDVVLPGGEHAFAVVPTGATPETAIAAGTIALGDGTLAYAALLGTLDSASVGLFEVDDRPLGPGSRALPDHQRRSRRRRSPRYSRAAMPCLSLLGSGMPHSTRRSTLERTTWIFSRPRPVCRCLTLPQTPFAEGTTTDMILVGQVSDGTMTALVEPIQVEIARAVGRSAQIFTGSCAGLEAVAADLGIVQTGQGAAVGSAGTDPVAQVFGSAGIPFATSSSLRTPSSFRKTSTPGARVVACGDIGGNLTDTGALVIALQTQGTGAAAGVAVLAPALEDPGATGVSVFLVGGVPAAGAAATPVSYRGVGSASGCAARRADASRRDSS